MKNSQKAIVLKGEGEPQVISRFQAYVTVIIIVLLTTINPKGRQVNV